MKPDGPASGQLAGAPGLLQYWQNPEAAMALPTIFEICEPRPDILDASRPDADFAADLAQVLRGAAPPEYQDPALFFANTYPTRGVRELLGRVAARLSGNSQAAVFRLDTNYGGGKTHALIALAHLATSSGRIPNLAEFVEPGLAPVEPARVAAFDGEIADPANGRALGLNIFARTPWGELAYALAGAAGYERVRASDEAGIAPGSETLRALIGDAPVLILMDELAVYLRKAGPEVRRQFTAFLAALIKAVEGSPAAALVYTLALGKLESQDAFRSENVALQAVLREALSVSARKETLLDPTSEEETVHVLRRRLFRSVDEEGAAAVVDSYIRLWNQNREALPPECQHEQVRESFRTSYPLHPELMETFMAKTATLADFQRVRGMLRILGRAVQRLWQTRPQAVHALQASAIDLADGHLRQEITSRLKQTALVPCLRADVAASEGDAPSQAELLDERYYGGMPPYGRAVAGAIFLHTLAYNEALQGATRERLRYALLSPAFQAAFIDDAITRFQDVSLYLDDRPGVPLRFSREPNLTALVEQFRRRVEMPVLRSYLREQTERVFKGSFFRLALFPATAAEAPDSAEKPVLVLISPEAEMGGAEAPELARRIWQPVGEKPRLNLNNIIFVAADAAKFETAQDAARQKLALDELLSSAEAQTLGKEQLATLKGRREAAGKELAQAIQAAYCHLYYPAREREGAPFLEHLVIASPLASAAPGDGERQIRTSLAGPKLKPAGSPAASARYLVSRTGLRKGVQSMAALWADFHEDPGLPLLEDASVLLAAVRQALVEGVFVYKNGEFVAGPGEPLPRQPGLGAEELIYTREQAMKEGVWPRKSAPASYLPQLACLAGGSASLADIMHEYLLDKGAKPTRAAVEEELVRGLAAGEYVLTAGENVWGQGVPAPAPLPEAGTVYRAEQARAAGIWPKSGEQEIAAGANGATIAEAFHELGEKMAAQGLCRIASLAVTAYVAQDGFALARAAATLPGSPHVRLDASWQGPAGAEFHMELEKGSCAEAAAVGQFVQPQLRAAAEQSFELELVFRFEPELADLGKIEAVLGRVRGAAYLVVKGSR